MLGGVIGGRRTDMEFRRLTVKNMGNAVPEFKLSIMRVFAFFPPVGLMLYSWSADQALPWAVSDLGLFIYAIGMSASVISAQVRGVLDKCLFLCSPCHDRPTLSSAMGCWRRRRCWPPSLCARRWASVRRVSHMARFTEPLDLSSSHHAQSLQNPCMM